MICNFLLITNLPWGIKKEDLIRNLVSTFPEEFSLPFSQQTLKVILFDQGTNSRGAKVLRAVATGFAVNLSELQRKAAMRQIGGRYWVFKQDQGDARDEKGNFIEKQHPSARRLMYHMEGRLIKRPTFLLQKFLRSDISSEIWNFSNTVYIKKQKINVDILRKPGLVISTIEFRDVTKVNYASTFEALQALMTLSGQDGIKFCNMDGTIISNHKSGPGLGKNGDLLNIQLVCFQNGFLPFTSFRNGVINDDIISSLTSRCWKCKNSYRVVGIDPSFEFLAGKCYCKYSSELDITSKTRAYFWEGEAFTRLLPGPDSTADLIIYYKPLRLNYADAQDYRNSLQPLLTEEWKYNSKSFKEDNQCQGFIRGVQFIETITSGKLNAPRVHMYSIQLEVEKSAFWCATNYSKIGKITVEFNIRAANSDRTIVAKRKAKLILMEDRGNSCLLKTKIKLEPSLRPAPNLRITITPKPIKTEYNSSKDFLKKWTKKPENYPTLRAIINPSAPLAFPDRHQKSARVDVNQVAKRLLLTRLCSSLNSAQREAMNNALNSPLSIIQGPPGTGKSYLCSIMATTLVLREIGHVIVACPSNLATDGLAEQIGKIIKDNPSIDDTEIKVLRIYSTSLEQDMLTPNGTKHPNFGQNVDILHEMIRRSENWLSGEKYQNIRKKIESNTKELLTTLEEELLNSHIASLEHETIGRYRIIAVTVGCLADYRVLSYSTPDKIATIIVDEAGQLSQASCLPLFKFNQRRTVLVGDNNQLRAHVNSFPAEAAGLGLSIMDWVKMGGCQLPWIMLKCQHRMNPTNRKVVSRLSYNDQLSDSNCVLDEPEWVKDLREVSFGQIGIGLESPVVVFCHLNAEGKEGTSYYNMEEVEFAESLSAHLLAVGIEAEKIAVLSMYEAQKIRVQNRVSKMGITVKTVDAFQGREASIIILSMVRGGDTVGFAANLNRINVAISRAKHLMFILMNYDTFEKSDSLGVKSFLSELRSEADFRTCVRREGKFAF